MFVDSGRQEVKADEVTIEVDTIDGDDNFNGIRSSGKAITRIDPETALQPNNVASLKQTPATDKSPERTQAKYNRTTTGSEIIGSSGVSGRKEVEGTDVELGIDGDNGDDFPENKPSGPALKKITRPSTTDGSDTVGDNNGWKKFSSFKKASNITGKDLVWSDVNMTLKDRKGRVKKEILQEVWGAARSGEMTAIMGASGSGKTSLFSILTGRNKTKGKIDIESDIRLGGINIAPERDAKVRNLFAFVAQEESLHVSSTPRESMAFSARLRLPRTTTKKVIDDLVENCIRELGISSCADSIIGGGLHKGISGGEKRRVSIGVELVAHPSIIFLDEPTSGLDSFATKQVLKVLEKVARSGNTVIFTIHQPSSEVFASFDRLILMNKGRTMYAAATADVGAHFDTMGYPLPPKYNPADWILDVAETNSVPDLERAGFFEPAPEKICTSDDELAIPNHDHVSRWVEFRMLMRREWISITRSPAPMIINVLLTAFLALVSGAIFFQIGQEERTNLLVLQGQLGALVNMLISTMMGQSQTALTIFSSERLLFLREYATKHYSIGPYFVSHLATETLQAFAAVLVQSLISVYMIGFQQTFWQFFGVSFALSMTSTAVSVWLGSIFSDPKVAASLFSLVVVPQFYFSGVFVSISLIPSWISWVQWLCSLTYAGRLTMLYEFGDCTEGDQEQCNQFLDTNGVDQDGAWWYWLSLLALFIFFRAMAAITLRLKGLNFE